MIPVPPDRETLAAIAEYTGGESFDAETAGALRDVYQGLGSRVGRRERPREVTSAFVAAGRAPARRRGGRGDALRTQAALARRPTTH